MNAIESDDKGRMTKANTSPQRSPTPSSSDNDNSLKGERKKKSIMPRFFTKRQGRDNSSDEDNVGPSDENDQDLLPKMTSRKFFNDRQPSSFRKVASERTRNSRIEGLNLSNFENSMVPATTVQDVRVFVGTWNVGGNTPTHGLNLEHFLQVEGSADIYVLGFQEIVPLSAGNVLVIEDNEPASRWLAIISYALNKPYHESIGTCCDNSVGGGSNSKSNFFHKPSLKLLTKNIRADNTRLKACNCNLESIFPNTKPRKLSDPTGNSTFHHYNDSSIDNFDSTMDDFSDSPASLNYHLVASKQMVGLFLTIWARKELVRHIGHLRVDSVGRGIMGRLGNKGCISISLTLHQTTLCFVCSHLASGEKDGDELKRNIDVTEILKNTQFPKVCKNSRRQIPEKIIGHDRVIWLGDLNYRVALSYEETRNLLADNDWESLLENDQLTLERRAGRVFVGFSEGKIFFAPTYKYTHNSDSYAGETTKSKKKRRTPAWCDRILWLGSGIEQLSYIRGESRFSDHRPVCAVFAVEVEMKTKNSKFRKGYSCTAASKMLYEDCLPPRHSFCD